MLHGVQVTMSADWSFNCIKMLEYGALDVRLLGPISLFTGLVALVYHCLRSSMSCLVHPLHVVISMQ